MKLKGRSSLKQYLPKKTIKLGFKVWMCVDSTNGFVSDLEVYTGRSDGTTTDLGAKVVHKLSRELQGGFYHLWFDNFFSSLPLFNLLLENALNIGLISYNYICTNLVLYLSPPYVFLWFILSF